MHNLLTIDFFGGNDWGLILFFLFTDRANSSEEGVVEGILTRKHEWESTTKKASNRSWDKVCQT